MDMADLEAQLQAADEAGARVKLIATGEPTPRGAEKRGTGGKGIL